MSEEEINIAIAEYRGWQILEPEVHKAITYHWAIEPDGSKSILPDCCNDLNAMHEAEKVLTQDQMIDYSRHVGKSVTSHLPASRAAWMDFQLINATAFQRAEAFLRTIGKWEEAK